MVAVVGEIRVFDATIGDTALCCIQLFLCQYLSRKFFQSLISFRILELKFIFIDCVFHSKVMLSIGQFLKLEGGIDDTFYPEGSKIFLCVNDTEN